MADIPTPVPIRFVLRVASPRSPAERVQDVLRVTARAWALDVQRPAAASRYGMSDTRGFHPIPCRQP